MIHLFSASHSCAMSEETPAPQRRPVSTPSAVSDEKVSLHDSLEHVNGNIRNFDVAVSIAAGHANDDEVDRLEDLRLRRKLDLHLLPLLFSVFCSQFVVCYLSHSPLRLTLNRAQSNSSTSEYLRSLQCPRFSGHQTYY